MPFAHTQAWRGKNEKADKRHRGWAQSWFLGNLPLEFPSLCHLPSLPPNPAFLQQSLRKPFYFLNWDLWFIILLLMCFYAHNSNTRVAPSFPQRPQHFFLSMPQLSCMDQFSLCVAFGPLLLPCCNPFGPACMRLFCVCLSPDCPHSACSSFISVPANCISWFFFRALTYC